MKTCPNCNALNNDISKFCEVCGSALEEPQTAETTVLTETPETTVLNEAPVYTAPQQPTYQAPAQPVAQPQYQAPVQPGFAPQMYPINEAMLPSEYQPVSIGSYIGHSLLFSLPIIGFIMLIVTACSSSKSKSLRNYAKAMLIMYAIAVVFSVLFSIFGIVLMEEIMYW